MADNETHVIYKAIADFSALSRAARKAKRDLAALKKEEASLNAQSVAGSAASTVASAKQAKGREALVKQFEAEAGATQKATASVLKNAAATRQMKKESDDAVIAVNALTGEVLDAADASDELTAANKRVGQAYRENKKSMAELNAMVNATTKYYKRINGEMVEVDKNGRRIEKSMGGAERGMRNAMNGVGRLNKQLDRLGNWRPHILPPFIALVPIIGGIIALINPLIAGLGAVGAAGLGFASSLGRVAAGAIGAIPALTTLLSVVGALKVAFGGIGGAFKAFSNMKKAAAGGGGSTSQKAELTRTEEITRAQEKYARSIQDVAWAQQDLDDARKGYIKRLIDLQKAVDRAAMSEARAAANSQLARENYANVLADPGSTKGQKMDAKVGVEEAANEYNDVVAENKQNAADLAEMKKKGMEGDRDVIRAQRNLTDAIWAQRDAQLALINAQNGSADSASKLERATDLYEQALAKLSPSARKFVENLIGMKDAWDQVKRATQEAFFSKFVDEMWRLNGLLPSVKSLLTDTAGALGDVAKNLLLLITSPQWEKDLILIGKQNVPIIHNIGSALLSWLDAFKDLAIIAGPFLTELSEGLKDGAANFRDIVGRTRETGQLAAYLEKVRAAMSQWWRIIKNVGKTLFNYSAAAGSFGEWLTGGFEKLSEEWVKASEDARKEGSPFQKYLEDIKPLLVETRGLFGDFFRWLGKTMMDPENIKIWTDLVKILRERLGPALGEVLDVLTKSKVGEGLLNAISSIVEFIATFLDNGGIDGFKAFYDAVSVLFDLLNKFIKLVPPPVLSVLATTFATLAALRFFGITKLLDKLLLLGKGGMIAKLTGLFRGMGDDGAAIIAGGGKGGKGGGGKGGATVYAPGTRRAPGGGSYKAPRRGFRAGGGIGGLITGLGLTFLPDIISSLFGGGGDKGGAAKPKVGSKGSKGAAAGLDVLSSFGKTAKPSAAAGAGKGFNLLGSIGKGAGRGAGLGAVASIVGTVGGDLISSGAPEGAAGAGQRVGGNTLAGAASGAGIGAMVGSVVPGVGTAIGAGAGGIIGALVGFFTSAPEDIANMTKEWGNFFADVGKWFSSMWNGFMTWLTVDLPGWVQSVADGFWKWLTVDLPGWLQSIGDGFMHWLTVDLPYGLGYAAGLFWKWLTVDFPAWVASIAQIVWKWLTVDFPAWVASIAQTVWKWLTVDMPAWVASMAQRFWRWLTVDVPAWLATVAQRFWRWLTVDVPAWIGKAADNFWHWLTIDLPNWIKDAADKFWKWLTVDLPKGVVDAGKAIGDGFTNFFKDFFSNTGKFFKSIGDGWNNWWGNLFGGFKDATGDAPRGVGGGGGATEKRIRSLLPKGMRVTSTYRSPEENRKAGGVSNSLHMDRNNPAVDIAGTIPQMNAFARVLAHIGGWRQLIYNNIDAPGITHFPGHGNHIHVANTGGKVPGSGNGDTVPSMLTPGEFVVRKAIVNKIGPDNLARLNSGIMSYAQLLQQAMSQKGKEKQTGGGFGGLEMLAGGGLVPDFGGFGGANLPPGPGPHDFGGAPGNGGGMSFGDIIINNPAPEPASDSLPRSIRKVSYIGARRS